MGQSNFISGQKKFGQMGNFTSIFIMYELSKACVSLSLAHIIQTHVKLTRHDRHD